MIFLSSGNNRFLFLATDGDGAEIRRCFEQLGEDNYFKVSHQVSIRMTLLSCSRLSKICSLLSSFHCVLEKCMHYIHWTIGHTLKCLPEICIKSIFKYVSWYDY